MVTDLIKQFVHDVEQSNTETSQQLVTPANEHTTSTQNLKINKQGLEGEFIDWHWLSAITIATHAVHEK